MPTQQLEAEVLPFPESTITFFWYKYFKRYRHFNKEQLQDMSLTMFFFLKMTLHIPVVVKAC